MLVTCSVTCRKVTRLYYVLVYSILMSIILQGWLFSYDPFWRPAQMKVILTIFVFVGYLVPFHLCVVINKETCLFPGTFTFCSCREDGSPWPVCWSETNMDYFRAVLWCSLHLESHCSFSWLGINICIGLETISMTANIKFKHQMAQHIYALLCSSLVDPYLLSLVFITGVCCTTLQETLRCMAFWMQ